jgi:hypothetical protein
MLDISNSNLTYISSVKLQVYQTNKTWDKVKKWKVDAACPHICRLILVIDAACPHICRLILVIDAACPHICRLILVIDDACPHICRLILVIDAACPHICRLILVKLNSRVKKCKNHGEISSNNTYQYNSPYKKSLHSLSSIFVCH